MELYGEIVCKLIGSATLLLFIFFMPLSVISFYRFRLNRKRDEYERIIETLKVKGAQASLLAPSVENEYSVWDYALPVAFATFLCLMGFAILYQAETFAKMKHIILSGLYAEKDFVNYQEKSMLALLMAFLGSYLWSIQNILRRLITIDLPPGAYYHVSIRIILSAFLALVLRYAIEDTILIKGLPVFAFFTGMFPERMLYFLKERSKIFSEKGLTRANDFPLTMIEGMSVFHKVRLEEIGVDNAQNLAQANLVELIVRTPFKASLLIDWQAQAILYTHFHSNIDKLRQVGVRTVLDFREVGAADGRLAELAEQTGLPKVQLEAVYQVVQKNPLINFLADAQRLLT